MSEHESLKYRVVGALVVIISLVLAYTILLEHDVQREYDWTKSDIPEPMKIERFDVPQVEPIEEVEAPVVTKVTVPQKASSGVSAQKDTAKMQALEASDKAGSSKNTNTKPATSKNKDFTKLGADGLPEAWVLQVGSFKARENAIALQSKLRKDDLPAYVKAFKLDTGVNYRVLVGPKLVKTEAEAMGKKIRSKHKLKPMIMKFKPGYAE